MGLYIQHQFLKMPFIKYFQVNTYCHFKDYTWKFSLSDFPCTERICIARGDFHFEELLNHRGAVPDRLLHLWVTAFPLRVFLLLCNSPFEDLHIDEETPLKIFTLLGWEQPFEKCSHHGRSTFRTVHNNRVLPF